MGAGRVATSSSAGCALPKGREWRLEMGSRGSVHQRGSFFLKFTQGALRLTVTWVVL